LHTVAKLTSGTGQAQASTIFKALKDWDVGARVYAMCFNTSSKTGRHSAIQMLGKELLYLECCYHVLELVVGAVFQASMGSTSGSEIPLFKRFQSSMGVQD